MNILEQNEDISTTLNNKKIIPIKNHRHYFKSCPYDEIDVYRVLLMFDVSDPCIAHAAKKLLVAGGRGYKSAEKDIQDAIDSLVRWQEMRAEETEKS